VFSYLATVLLVIGQHADIDNSWGSGNRLRNRYHEINAFTITAKILARSLILLSISGQTNEFIMYAMRQ